MSVEDINCIESALCTEEGMLILKEVNACDDDKLMALQDVNTIITENTLDMFLSEPSPTSHIFHEDEIFTTGQELLDSSLAEDVSFADKVPIIICTSPPHSDAPDALASEEDILADGDMHPLDDIVLSDLSVVMETKPPDPTVLEEEDFVLDDSILQVFADVLSVYRLLILLIIILKIIMLIVMLITSANN